MTASLYWRMPFVPKGHTRSAVKQCNAAERLQSGQMMIETSGGANARRNRRLMTQSRHCLLLSRPAEVERGVPSVSPEIQVLKKRA